MFQKYLAIFVSANYGVSERIQYQLGICPILDPGLSEWVLCNHPCLSVVRLSVRQLVHLSVRSPSVGLFVGPSVR